MAFDPDAILGITPSKGGFDPDAALGLKKPEIGGFTAAAKQVVGSTIKGVGQVGADYLPGVAQDNALTRYGQEVVDANLTRVQGFQDIIDQPWTTIKEAVGNAAPSVGGALGLRAAGQGITALAPFAGLAAPVVAGLGQAVSWGGPIIAAGLPSYGGIREEQLKTGNDGAVDKALALGGSAAVGAIEMAGGPQARALKALTGGLKREAGESIYKAVGKEALKSGLEEGAEELLQNPIEQAASYKNPLTTENLKETAFGGAMGFIGGGVLGGGMQLAGGQKEVPPVPPAIEEVQRQALAKATGGEVEIIDGVATITSGDNTITAPVESLTRHFTEGKTLDTFDTAAATASKLNEVRTAVQDENDPFTFDTLVAMSKDPEALKQAGLNRRDVEALVEAEIERGEIPEAAWIKQERAAQRTNQEIKDRIQGITSRVANAERNQFMDEQVRQYEQTGLQVPPAAPTVTIEGQTGQGMPVMEQSSVLSQQPEWSSRYADLLDVFGDDRTARLSQERSTTAQPAITRLTDLEQKAQGLPGVATPTSLSPQEEQEYVMLRTQVSPVDAQRMQEYQANVARRDALALKQSGAQAFETVGEGGTAVINQGATPQTLTPKEQADLAQLTEVTRKPPVSPYVDDSRTLAAGLPAAQSETLFSQRPPWETGPVQDKETVTAVAQQVSPGIRYDGAMLDLHQFTHTNAAGQEATFSVKGEVTPQTVHAALNTSEAKFGMPLTPAPPAALMAQGATPTEPINAPALRARLNESLGKGTAQRLIRQGKLQIVATAADVPGGDKLSAVQQRLNQGVYKTKLGKIYLVAGNLSKSTVTGVFKHEVVHALLRQDATFMARREALLKDFAKLVGKDASVDAAAAKVPAGTQESVRVEEALAYWVQDEANHKHSLFRRIVAAVKAALKRLGIPTTSMTPADFSRLFTQGTEAFVNEGAQVEQTVANQNRNENLDPLEAEAKKVQKEVEGKTLVEVADYLTNNAPNESYQIIARKVKTTLQRLTSAGVTMEFNVAHLGDQVPMALINSRGLSTANMRNGMDIKVWVNGDDVIGKVGVSYETVLHELIHAATQGVTYVGTRKAAQGKSFSKASLDLINVSNQVIQHFNTRVKESQNGGTPLSEFEQRIFGRLNNALHNEQEVLAWALTNKDMQDYLEGIKINKTDTLWSTFVVAVRTALGLTPAADTALSEVLRTGEEILNAPIDQVMEALDAMTGKATAKQVDAFTVSNEQQNTLFSQASAGHQQARQSLTTSLKEMAKDKLTEASPFLLRISPLRTLVQTLGNKIQQINKISEAFDEMNHTNTSMVEDAKGNYDAHKELNKKATGNNDKFNTAATLSTFYRMTPWKNLDEQEWVPTTGTREERLMTAEKKWKAAGMDKSTGKTFIAAWTEASKAYREVGSKEAQDQYRKMARHMRHIRQREETNVLATIESATVGNPKLRAEMMERFNATFKNITGTYWPLTRDGEYILQYKDADGLPVVEHFQSAQARTQARKMLEQGGATEIQQGYASKAPRGQVSIPGELMQQFSQAIIAEKTKGLDPEQDAAAYQSAAKGAQDTINDLNQIWLRWQPETAALKNAIQRRNIKGYDLNAGRAYLEYVQRHAQSIAWTEQGKVIEGHLKDLQDKVKEDRKAGKNVDLPQMVLNDLRERVQAARDSHVGPIASFVGKLGTAMYMTSPSIALVQMTQLPMLTLPKLGVMYNSPGRAAKALMSGVRQAFSKKFNREAMFEDDKVNALFDMTRFVVTEENKNEPGAAGKALGQRVHDDAKIAELFGRLSKDQQKLFILRESLARNLLDISATHEAYAIAQGKDPDSAWRKVFDLAMAPMRISEQASRKAAILATMEMAQAQGKDVNKIMSDVSEVVNDTLYSYDKTNKPTFLQGSTGRVLAMFQWYRIMTMFRMALLFKRSIAAETPEIKAAARKEFVGIMGMAGVLAGTLGMPMAGLIFAALDASSDDDEPRDSALEWRNFLQEQFGERLGNIAAYGLSAALGMHITKRVGMGDMFGMQSQPPPNVYGKDLAAWWAANQLGPAFSIGQGFVQGYDEMVNKGNVIGGMEAVLPKPLKDMMKAYRLWDEGELKSAGGKRVLGPDQITPDMIPLIALGFNPLEAAKMNEANYSRSKLGAQMSRRRGRMLDDIANALQGDGDIDGAYEALADFNRKNPAFTIRGGEIRSAIKRNIKTGLGIPSKRERMLNTVYEIPATE